MTGRKPGVYWDETWNPLVGCRHVSEGCRNCWAEGFARRHVKSPNPKIAADYAGVADSNGWTGKVNLLPHKLAQPLSWRKPRVISVEFQGDLFGEGVPDEYIAAVFGVMAACPQHTLLVLTKRAKRMAELFVQLDRDPPVGGRPPQERIVRTAKAAARRWLGEYGWRPIPGVVEDVPPWPLPNVWLGVSVEDQAAADERVPYLLQTPAAKRFVSVEPMLGPLNIAQWLEPGSGYETLDWVICGGESGPHGRLCRPDWVRWLRDQCIDARVSFWFKQWGTATARRYCFAGDGVAAYIGRDLDGRTWDGVPS